MPHGGFREFARFLLHFAVDALRKGLLRIKLPKDLHARSNLPGKPVAHNYGLLSANDGLL